MPQLPSLFPVGIKHYVTLHDAIEKEVDEGDNNPKDNEEDNAESLDKDALE
jgi:hypothetical protein